MSPPDRLGGTAAASGLVVLGLVCQEVGAGVAVLLFPEAGPIGTVTLRLVFSAVLLLAIFRPRFRGRTRADWLTVLAFGAVLGGMNAVFYLALDRLPLGPTVTIEYLGPLVLSVVVARRASAWLWAALALAGVALLGRGGFDHLDPLGVLFAASAGVLWVGYILLSARTGRRWARLDGLAIAAAVGGLGVLPFGIATSGGAFLDPRILLFGLGFLYLLKNPSLPASQIIFTILDVRIETNKELSGAYLIHCADYYDGCNTCTIKEGKVKVELGLAKGKKVYDKREDIKRREIDLEMRRAMKGRRK